MYQPTADLAGQVCFRPNFFQTKGRINHLIDRYLNDTVLCDRLDDLPYLLSQIHTILSVSYEPRIRSSANIKSTLQRMMSVLNWQSWSRPK